jgi:medium-chain acyl-[acyl-carrier-protein] hydrolase
LHLPIDVYGGLSDPQVTRDDLDGWRAHTTAGFRLKQFAGDHFYLIPRKDELLRDISQSLPRTFG